MTRIEPHALSRSQSKMVRRAIAEYRDPHETQDVAAPTVWTEAVLFGDARREVVQQMKGMEIWLVPRGTRASSLAEVIRDAGGAPVPSDVVALCREGVHTSWTASCRTSSPHS